VTTLDRAYQVIKKPVMTEKASDAMQARNAYTFRVPMDANKIEIRHSIERLFDVKVLSVNTLIQRGKWRRRGQSVGQAKNWKKAVVALAEGSTIDVL
jgi:large subunit ribosomal protein L23